MFLIRLLMTHLRKVQTMTERKAYKTLTGAEEIEIESRFPNISRHGTEEYDDAYTNGEMALAAICYASPVPIYRRDAEVYSDPWPWKESFDHRNKGNRVQHLIIAGNLIAAEIDRLKRIETQVCVPREIKSESPDESL